MTEVQTARMICGLVGMAVAIEGRTVHIAFGITKRSAKRRLLKGLT